MSLINDALKRATKAQPATQPAPELERELEPAPPHRAVGIPGYFTPAILCILSAACWFIARGWNGGPIDQTLAKVKELAAPETIVASAREITVSARELAAAGMDLPPTEGAELPVPDNRQFALNDAPTDAPSTAAPAESSTAAVTPPVENAAASAPVSFKLQGIIYRPSNPSAVVNARTVFIGDTVGNARVRSISEQSVTLEVGGETRVLTLTLQ